MGLEQAVAFIELCASDADIDTVIAGFRRAILELGFTASVCGAWSGVGKQRVHRFYFNDWPQDWLELYARLNYFEDDPAVAEARRRMTPFDWRDMRERPNMPEKALEIMQTAHDYGWREVIGFPIHGPADYQGLATLAAKTEIPLTPGERAALRMMVLAVHDRCRESTSQFGTPELEAKLTTREIECLRWAASGKTDWEIGQMLGISSSTAHFHIEKAKTKLNKTKRTEAIALLVLHGLI